MQTSKQNKRMLLLKMQTSTTKQLMLWTGMRSLQQEISILKTQAKLKLKTQPTQASNRMMSRLAGLVVRGKVVLDSRCKVCHTTVCTHAVQRALQVSDVLVLITPPMRKAMHAGFMLQATLCGRQLASTIANIVTNNKLTVRIGMHLSSMVQTGMHLSRLAASWLLMDVGALRERATQRFAMLWEVLPQSVVAPTMDADANLPASDVCSIRLWHKLRRHVLAVTCACALSRNLTLEFAVALVVASMVTSSGQ